MNEHTQQYSDFINSLQKGESKLGLEREQALDDLDKMLGTDEDDEDNEIYNLN